LMMHQANMATFVWNGRNTSQIDNWMRLFAPVYEKSLTFPLRSWKNDDLCTKFRERQVRDECAVESTLVIENCFIVRIEMLSGQDCVMPLTGVISSGLPAGTTYGPDYTVDVQLTAATTKTIWLDTPVPLSYCTPVTGTTTSSTGSTTGSTAGSSGSTTGTTTGNPTTGVATTDYPTTSVATTGYPTSGVAATGNPTTGVATTGNPTTGVANPTTGNPTTGVVTTGVATTDSPSFTTVPLRVVAVSDASRMRVSLPRTGGFATLFVPLLQQLLLFHCYQW
jgi:hypothetical protein